MSNEFVLALMGLAGIALAGGAAYWMAARL